MQPLQSGPDAERMEFISWIQSAHTFLGVCILSFPKFFVRPLNSFYRTRDASAYNKKVLNGRHHCLTPQVFNTTEQLLLKK